MAYVLAVPEMMTAAATDLAGIGSALSEAHMAAASPTVSLIPAAADEVSAAVTHLFSEHAAGYQAVAAQAAAFQQQFVQHVNGGASSYASIEAALASLLHDLNVNSLLTNGTRHAALVNETGPSLQSLEAFLQFLAGYDTYLAAIFAPLPPLQKLEFVLLLPVLVPLFLFGYAFQQL